jgi:hypothetical protein
MLDSLGLLPLLGQGLLPLAHRWEEPGDDVMSPHFQVQRGIKMTHQETPVLLPPFPHLAGWVTPLPSVKLFYLTPSLCSAWILPFGTQGTRSENNDQLLITLPQAPKQWCRLMN